MVDTNALGWVIAIVGGLSTLAIFIGRLFTASRVYRTQADSDKEFGYVYKRMEEIDDHVETQDKAIHAMQIAQAESAKDLRYIGDSMNRLATSVDRLISNSQHTPQCQVQGQTPERPAEPEWPHTTKNPTRRNRTQG